MSPYRLSIAAASLAVLTGCAATGAPGTGTGADYTPIIDTAGVNMSQYGNDLTACRQLARTVDVNTAMNSGAIAGMLAGAAVSAILGGGRQNTIEAASLGGLSGMSRQGDRAVTKAQSIIINCMVGRGYRALEVTPPMGAAPGQQPFVPLQPQPAIPPRAPEVAIGQESYQVERMPAVLACNATPKATLAGKGPGNELYAVACTNGTVLSVRCEFGTCRVLQ
jgi:hypothetical protein